LCLKSPAGSTWSMQHWLAVYGCSNRPLRGAICQARRVCGRQRDPSPTGIAQTSRCDSLSVECTGTCVTLWTGDIRYKPLAVPMVRVEWVLRHKSSRRGRGNVGIPKGFPKSVGRVGSRLHGFPCFPYSVISMACFFARAMLDFTATSTNEPHSQGIARRDRVR
jgi:hypothetical protein